MSEKDICKCGHEVQQHTEFADRRCKECVSCVKFEPNEPKPAVVLPVRPEIKLYPNHGTGFMQYHTVMGVFNYAEEIEAQLLQAQTELADAKDALKYANEQFSRATELLDIQGGAESELTELRAAVVELAGLMKQTFDYTRCDSDCGCPGDALFAKSKQYLDTPLIQRTLAAAEGKEK